MTQIAGRRRWWIVLVGVLVAYLLLAYAILPALWSHHEHEPGLASLPMVTRTASDIPGDALNVGLVGSKEDVLRAMHAAGWYPADPITLRSSVEIVGSVVLDRGTDGRPVWLGSVTFDRGVGLSHDTGQVTHHIAPDIDAERDLLMHDLREAGMVQNFFQISGIGPTLFARNGEGDPYYTDGEIDVATLVIDGVRQTQPPVTIPPPPLIALKDQIWHSVSSAIGR